MKFERQGLLAISPEAFSASYEASTQVAHLEDSVEVVHIVGPLEQYENPFFDSYTAISRRVAEACQTPAKTIVLVIDSPGGQVAGLFDCANDLRRLVTASGKRLKAYVSGTCCSAAYALACVADQIVASSTSIVGSIGVIDARIDVSQANESQGVKVSFVSSGSTKAFGHPNLALTDAEMIERQRVVDDLAKVFFDHVKSYRGLDATQLDARVYVGQSALATGLVDSISSYTDFIAKELTPMSFDEILETLRQMAEGEGDEAEKAREALDKLTAPETVEEPTEEPTEEPPVEVSTREEEPSALAAELATLKAQLADMQSVVASLPKPKVSARAVAVTVPATQGKPADSTKATPALSAEDKRVDALMGITKPKSTNVVHTAYTTVLGAKESK